MATLLSNGPELRVAEVGEGEIFDVAGARFVWKVKGEETGSAFSIYEQTLSPGEGVPLHHHPYAEVFYILAGQVQFRQVSVIRDHWIACTAGQTVIVPADARHAFRNQSSDPARLLSVSTQRHQDFFDAIAASDRHTPFAALPPAEAMVRVADEGRQYEMYFLAE